MADDIEAYQGGLLLMMGVPEAAPAALRIRFAAILTRAALGALFLARYGCAREIRIQVIDPRGTQ